MATATPSARAPAGRRARAIDTPRRGLASLRTAHPRVRPDVPTPSPCGFLAAVLH